jgi:hypothetical protein
MILLVLCTFALGAVFGCLVIIRVDQSLLAYIVSREKKLEYRVKGSKTSIPIILEPEDTLDDEEKAERLHKLVDTVYEDNG